MFRAQFPNFKKLNKNQDGRIGTIYNIHLSFDSLWIPPRAQGHPQLVATEGEVQVIPPPSSRPFPWSCTHTQIPLPCQSSPGSSSLCISPLISCSQSTAPSPALTARSAGSTGEGSNGETQPGTLKGLLCLGTPLSEVVLKSRNELICIFPLKHAE